MNTVQRLANRGRDLLFLPFMDGHWRRRLQGKVMCLLYHRVDEPGHFPFLDRAGSPVIAPAALERELRFLQGQGARFLTFADLRRGEFPGPDDFGVIACFDDGFLDNYTRALPILERLGIRATLFQATALIEARSLIWEHALYWQGRDPGAAHAFAERVHAELPDSRAFQGGALIAWLREQVPTALVEALLEQAVRCGDVETAELARRLYPTAAHLRRARDAGHELGSHGHHHYKRSNIDAATFERELVRSVEVLDAVLGQPPAAFSYPFNSYRPDDTAICARHFAQAATVDRQFIEPDTDPLRLPRFTWPGPARNALRQRRWLLTGTI